MEWVGALAMDWFPEIGSHPGPRYMAIADAMAEDIRHGRLAPGSRLPTQRVLASRLQTTVGTVSRAYTEAERRGLIEGQVGRGTFVRQRAQGAAANVGAEAATAAPGRRDDPVTRSGRTGSPPAEPPPSGTPQPVSSSASPHSPASAPAPASVKPVSVPPAPTLRSPFRPANDVTAETSGADTTRAGRGAGDGVRGGGPIDLATSRPVSGPHEEALIAAVGELSNEDVATLLDNLPAGGRSADRTAGAAWLRLAGVDAETDRVVVAPGGQAAIAASLSALLAPGDGILVERLTWPGLKGILSTFDLKPHLVQIDDRGIIPESLELACWTSGARLLYMMPSLHVPTATTQTVERRREIIDIARRYRLTLVEDLVYAPLGDRFPDPYGRLAPERTITIAGLSKAVAPGLRVAYVAAPGAATELIVDRLRALHGSAASLPVAVATRWIENGTAERLLSWQRREARLRQNLASSILVDAPVHRRGGGLHLWLGLPEHWSAADLVLHAGLRGVLVTAGDRFSVGRSKPVRAIRVSLGAVPGFDTLRRGLRVLGVLLAGTPADATGAGRSGREQGGQGRAGE